MRIIPPSYSRLWSILLLILVLGMVLGCDTEAPQEEEDPVDLPVEIKNLGTTAIFITAPGEEMDESLKIDKGDERFVVVTGLKVGDVVVFEAAIQESNFQGGLFWFHLDTERCVFRGFGEKGRRPFTVTWQNAGFSCGPDWIP